MVENNLLEQVGRLGLPLMEAEPDFDVNATLAKAVRSKEGRLWEGFPVLLANAAKDNSFDYESVKKGLPEQEKENLHALLLLALALYQYYNLSFFWADRLQKKLSDDDAALVKKLKSLLVRDEPFELAGMRFDSGRLKGMFNNYFEQDARETRRMKDQHEELALEYALSRLFSVKQKELFKKKLAGLPLTKTEREYYSRTVKKKVAALANPELHRLAQKLMNY